jgi:hypothetical protein
VWTLSTRKDTKKAPEQGKHCARGGTRTTFQAFKTLETLENIPNPGQTGPYSSRSEAKSVDIVNTYFLPARSHRRSRSTTSRRASGSPAALCLIHHGNVSTVCYLIEDIRIRK